MQPLSFPAFRDPIWGLAHDKYELTCICRANLDAFLSRAPSTVGANLCQLQIDHSSAKSIFSIQSLLPLLGNKMWNDRVRMGITITTLHVLRRPGRYAQHLQYDSMPRTPALYRNMWRTREGYMMDPIHAHAHRRLWPTTCPTAGDWFSRFIPGAKMQMGAICKQNEADVVHRPRPLQ